MKPGSGEVMDLDKHDDSKSAFGSCVFTNYGFMI